MVMPRNLWKNFLQNILIGVEGEGEVDGVSGGEGGVGEVGACPVEGGADGGGAAGEGEGEIGRAHV